MKHTAIPSESVGSPQDLVPLLRCDVQALYLVAQEDGSLRIGTCGHCVLEEGRSERATLPQGDEALDFDRDGLLSLLKELGVHPAITDEYVCP